LVVVVVGAGKKGLFFTSIGRAGIRADRRLISEENAGWIINDQEVTIFGAF
jgi:hypothetical protein